LRRGVIVRDWLYVEDHRGAIWTVINQGKIGRTYNVSGYNEMTNIAVVDKLCQMVAEKTGTDVGDLLELKKFVTERPRHDMRYAIDATRIREECDWEPKETLCTGIRKTASQGPRARVADLLGLHGRAAERVCVPRSSAARRNPQVSDHPRVAALRG
jgi:dTDP-D-glucose 4,6-dehydratase